MDLTLDKRKIGPEKVITMLRAQGLTINPDDAAEILEILYFLALLFCKQHAAEL